jgi:hypothetical protein
MYKPNKHMHGFFHSLDHGKGNPDQIPGSGNNYKATFWLDARDRTSSWILPRTQKSKAKLMMLAVNEFSDFFDVQECQSPSYWHCHDFY